MLEITGVAVGLLYLWLEFRASAWLWIAGIVMPTIYLFVYWDAGLYADFGISVYYIIASIYGMIVWLSHRLGNTDRKDSPGGKPLPITRMPGAYWEGLVVICVALTALLGYILAAFTDSTVPWADGFTTALSIVAMWMLARKYLEQWLVWIAADIGCAVLYAYKDLWLTGGLYLLYAIIAVAGYRQWRKKMNQKLNSIGNEIKNS